MKDIAPELLNKLQESFRNKFNENAKIKKLNKLILEGKATHKESNEFSIEVGNILSHVYQENLSSDIVPDGKMYYNITNRIIEPTLRQNYELISTYSADVQSILNKEAGLNIKGLKPKLNQDKINGIVNKISDSDNFDSIKWMLDEPIKTFSQSIVDDTIKTNVDFHNSLGLKPKIIRKSTGHCCAWCNKLEGTYNYPDIPDNIYRRHRYCRCTVEYLPGNGKRQNVHTKKWKKDNESLESFREKQTENIIKSKEEKDNNEIKKIQRKLYNSLIGKKINDVKIKNISIHVAERAYERYVTIEDIVDTMNNPLKIGEIKYDKENRPSFGIIGQKATIYINPINQTITTTHKTSRKKVEKLLEVKNENRNK